jgi:hypothetical protein
MGHRTLLHRSAHDDVTSLDSRLHVREGHCDHVLAGGAEGVRDVGGEIASQPVQDAVDRSFQAIHPPKGNHSDDVIHLAVKLDKVAVSGEQVEPLPHMVEDKVELALRENNRMGR